MNIRIEQDAPREDRGMFHDPPRPVSRHKKCYHYIDVIMTTLASQITSLAVVYSTVYSDADERKHQSSASLAFVLGIHRGPVNSPHKWPVTRKMFPFDDVVMGMWKSPAKAAKSWNHIMTRNTPSIQSIVSRVPNYRETFMKIPHFFNDFTKRQTGGRTDGQTNQRSGLATEFMGIIEVLKA